MPTRRLLALSLLSAIVLGLCLAPLQANAWTSWYVDDAGTDSLSCGTTLDPCRTIQYALDKAASNDTLVLQPGTYSAATNGEVFPVNVAKSITINGSGRDVTMIDADNPAVDVISVAGYSIDFYLYGLSLRVETAGSSISGYAPTFATGVVDSVRLTANQTGIYTHRFSGGIEDSDISGNAHVGIHNYASSLGIARNVLGFNGQASLGFTLDAAIYNDESNPTLVNNVIGWNDGSGILNDQSSPTIVNNTIAYSANLALTGGGSGIANFDHSNPVIANNIVVASYVYGIHADGTSDPVASYNDVWLNGWGDYWDTPAGAGSISANPMFVSLLDAHLLCSSPAINAGNNAAPFVPSNDYELRPRPVGGTVDMGAYEWQSPFLCAVYLPLVIR